MFGVGQQASPERKLEPNHLSVSPPVPLGRINLDSSVSATPPNPLGAQPADIIKSSPGDASSWKPPSWQAASEWYLQEASQAAQSIFTSIALVPAAVGHSSQAPDEPASQPPLEKESDKGQRNWRGVVKTEMEPDEMVSTRWSPRGPCRSVQGAAHTLPNVSILSAEEQAVRRSMLPRGAAEQATWLATSVSRALLDVGPRPVQQDAACVFDIKGTTPVVVICDGHGSIQLRSGNHEMHAGGTQAADIASQVVQQYLQKYGNNFLLHSADIFMHAAFVRAHHVVLEQILAGAGALDGEECKDGESAVDGDYFRLLRQGWRPQGRDVIRKVVARLPQNGSKEVAFYERGDGTWDHCDFGTTCTCVLVLNAGDDEKPHRKVAVCANAGDSDACLLRFVPDTGGNAHMEAHWLTKEHSLLADEERTRPITGGNVLADAEGRDTLEHKVRVNVTLPTGRRAAVAYEPTRGLGHAMGQYYGVVPAPSISVTELTAGDVIVVASDGLWNALGGRRPPGDLGPAQACAGGALFSSLAKIMAVHRARDAQGLATELLAAARTRGLRDNTALAVFRVDAVSPPPVASTHGMQHAADDSTPALLASLNSKSFVPSQTTV